MTMEHWSDVLFGVGSYFVIGSLILFLHCFYDTGYVWNKRKAFLLFILSVIRIIVNLLDLVVVDGILFVTYFVIGLYDYNGKKLIGTVRFIITYYLIISLATAITTNVASNIIPNFKTDTILQNTDVRFIMYLLVSLYFMPLFVILYFKVYRRDIAIKCGKRETLFLCGYMLILIIILGCTIAEGKGSDDSLLMQSLFCAVTGVTPPILVFSLCIGNHYHHRTKLQEVYLQSELEHFRQYMHAQEETRRFRHDIRNNLLCMNEMVAAGDQEKLAQYLKDLLKITDTLSFKYVSGDDLLDSILNSKAPYMEQQGIRFELDGVLAGGLPWKPMDICAVFANAVDNAIEACQKVPPEERHISMQIKSTPQFWLISIENSVAEAVDTKKLFQKNGGYTSKSDSSRHGIGTYSMRRTVESYGAILEAKCTDQVFTLEIMIDKSK